MDLYPPDLNEALNALCQASGDRFDVRIGCCCSACQRYHAACWELKHRRLAGEWSPEAVLAEGQQADAEAFEHLAAVNLTC
jgi:hypothetical protein